MFEQSKRRVVEPNETGRENNKVRQIVEGGGGSGAMMNARCGISLIKGRSSFHGKESDGRDRPGAWPVLSSYLFAVMSLTVIGSGCLGGSQTFSGVSFH